MALRKYRDRIDCTQVARGARLAFLPKYFGKAMMHVESYVFTLADNQCADYKGGMWQFCELSNGGAFLFPEGCPERVTVKVDTNGYEGEMSREAAGIVFTLCALSHLSFRFEHVGDLGQTLAERFHELRAFAVQHPEWTEIAGAID